MSTFTIDSVQDYPREWNSTKGGPMLSYKINVTDEAGAKTLAVEWARKKDSPAPVVGQTLDGAIEPTDYGPKFKAAQGSFGGGGGGRQRDPKETAAIQRMAAHKAAVGLIQAKAQAGLATEEDFKPSKVAALTDWFFDDASRAKAAA